MNQKNICQYVGNGSGDGGVVELIEKIHDTMPLCMFCGPASDQYGKRAAELINQMERGEYRIGIREAMSIVDAEPDLEGTPTEDQVKPVREAMERGDLSYLLMLLQRAVKMTKGRIIERFEFREIELTVGRD